MLPAIEAYYRWHAPIYDLSRWSFLFGRSGLSEYYPELPPTPDILDLGCGTGRHLNELHSRYPNGHVTGIDRSDAMLCRARNRAGSSIQLIHGTYNNFRFEPGSFDLIIASYSLTMMENKIEILEAIRSHLKPGGQLLVVDFAGSRLPWFRRWMHMNHVDLEYPLFDHLSECFSTSETVRRSAWGGLYHYQIFLGLLR